MNKLSITFKWIMGALMIIGVLLLILVYLAIGEYNLQWLGLTADTALSTTVNWILYYTYIVFVIGLIAVLVGIMRNVVINPHGIIKPLIILAGFIAVVMVAYVLAPGNALIDFNGDFVPTGAQLKIADTMLYLTYITIAGAILAILFSGIYGKLKK